MDNSHKLKEINVNFESDSWFEQMYAQSLNTLLHQHLKFHPDEPAFLLFKLLSCTKTYLEGWYFEDRNEVRDLIVSEFEEIELILKTSLIGKKIEQRGKETAIGEFVETLVFYGMPRLPAIKATKEWLGLGQSTVRTYNENYRKNRCNNHMGEVVLFSAEAEIMRQHIRANPDFPMEHPKAKKAFERARQQYGKNIKEYIQNKYFSK